MNSRFITYSLGILFLLLILQSCVTTSRYQSASKTCTAFTCVNEVDQIEQQGLAEKGKRKLQIYLIRHAKPDVKKKRLYSESEARQYISDYNSADIIPFDSHLVQVNLNPDHVIYSSNLPRSKQTAQAIFGDNYSIVSDSIFREYEIRIVNMDPIVKVPLNFWKFFSRGGWMLGMNDEGIESKKEAKIRTKLAAEKLIKVAQEEETAVLVAHGFLNSGITKELKKHGWKVIQKKGHINLGATILIKIVDN